MLQHQSEPRQPAGVFKLNLRSAGMFSNVNEVVEQIRRAQLGGYRFVINWSNSAYRDPDRPVDPWLYYFQPCFAGIPIDGWGHWDELPELVGGVDVACSRDNIITPREADGICVPLLLPRDRHGAHAIIRNHIVLKEEIQNQIEDFSQKHLLGHAVIGLHVRGAGRTDGGVPAMRKLHGVTDGNAAPMAPFFDAVDRILQGNPAAKIFACSDSELVIRKILSRFGDRVVLWPSHRSEFGEMHANHPANSGLNFSPYALGLDVIAEAYLLSKSQWFVHGNSNVSNYVLCINPELSNQYILA